MLVFPNCKINLGLVITGKRTDKYHDIETIFYPVQLRDALEIITSNAPGIQQSVAFSQSGIPIDGDEKDNLCIKAFHLLKKDFPQIPSVKIHLHKAIPMGAGLGGGSADAAFTLLTLNEKYTLNLTEAQLLSYALQLGSDCPFFIINKPCIAKGRGEILRSLNLSLSGYRLILANPAIYVNTQWAFSQISISANETSLNDTQDMLPHTVVSQPIASWKDSLVNGFEKPVSEKYPAIRAIKECFYKKGALYASMSGSGSSVYGIFDIKALPSFNFPENYFLQNILL